jgi:hypothetical protein
VSALDVWHERIAGVRKALQGVRAAKTKVAALGSYPTNLARLKALEAIEHELEKVLPELRRELNNAMRNAA